MSENLNIEMSFDEWKKRIHVVNIIKFLKAV